MSYAILIPVRSTAIRAVGYASGILSVQFRNGRVYDFRGVPYFVYVGLLLAESKGAFYNANIRGRYR